MKPFNITENTKGVLVYGETRNGGRWLILISSVEKRDNDLIIYRHFSYHLNSNSLYIINTTNGRCWGSALHYGLNLYYPTHEQYQLVKRLMQRHKFKFIPILNQVKFIHE